MIQLGLMLLLGCAETSDPALTPALLSGVWRGNTYDCEEPKLDNSQVTLTFTAIPTDNHYIPAIDLFLSSTSDINAMCEASTSDRPALDAVSYDLLFEDCVGIADPEVPMGGELNEAQDILSSELYLNGSRCLCELENVD